MRMSLTFEARLTYNFVDSNNDVKLSIVLTPGKNLETNRSRYTVKL